MIKEPMDHPVIRVILRDGQSLKVRPVRAEDSGKLGDLFRRLSPESRYLRFGYAKGCVSEQELSCYTRLCPPDMYAYVALTGEGDDERIIADSRWFVIPGTGTAEIAFVVEDTIQFKGIGTALLEQLAEAALKHRIKRFIARVLPENRRMLDVFADSGFAIRKRMDRDAYELTIDLEEQKEFIKRQSYREHIARSAGVRKILYPKSIAVIGASRDALSVGGKVFRNLLQSGFSGTLYPVNPNTSSVGGVFCYPSVEDIPGSVDLAVVIVPAKKVMDVIDQCGRKRIPGAIIISAGFGEAGQEGKERQRLLREKALSYGIRCIGPNCLGIMNTDPGIGLNATFSAIAPPHGNLSISSHSGALGLALLDYVKNNNLGIAHFASIGNRMDISSNDLMEFWEDDENTKVILLYLETFGDARRFSRIARRISRKKPIIAVKSGRSEAGGRAASSHTGALAASDKAVDALFRQAGVIRVNTIEEMFNAAKVLANQPLPKGPRVAILTNAGGPGVLAADAAVARGLSVPALSDASREKLAKILPKEAALANPVDMIASAPGDHFGKSLGVLLEDPEIDAIIIINIPLRPVDEVAAGIKEAMNGYKGDKTVLSCFMTSEAQSIDLKIDPHRAVPVYMFPEDAVQALSHACIYSQYRNLDEGHILSFPDIDEEQAREYLASAGAFPPERGLLPPDTALQLLKKYGIPVPETRTAGSAEEAAETARRIGFPVAMKLRSRTITHKTDVGGIFLGLQTGAEVKQAFKDMEARLSAAGRGAEMEGVIIQPMLKGGQEVIIGMSHDPLFGPLVMAGMGGVQVELIKDIAFSLHPLTDADPENMLKRLKSLPLLEGWRGSAPKDIPALKDVLSRFSALIEDFPEIAEVEINPLMVFDRGGGCAAVDARMLVNGMC